ncbi:MAG: SET domain-containing protein [Bacteroidota bacterium]
MTKQQLLHELSHEMWIALKPSGIHGIGVFALCDIPKGCTTLFSKNTGGWLTISFEEATQLPAHSREFIETYYLYDDEKYFIPDHGTRVMDMASYLNHSSTPNIVSVNDGECFETLRVIREGEELFVNYGEIVEGAESYPPAPSN